MDALVPPLLFLALSGAASLTPEALAAAPRFRMVLEGGVAEQGVKTVSLVKSPAIQRGWVALSAVEPAAPQARRFHLSAEGPRQVLTGPALIPGQEILRLDAEGNPFYITFDAENIAATQRQFAAQLRHLSTNEDHATALEGNIVEESWLIADAACDKAVALGLTGLPAGTWMLSLHVPDADYWQKEIVSDNKLGFSIEGLFATEQLTLSAAAPAPVSLMKVLFQKISTAWAQLSAEQKLALGLEKLADGRTVSIDDTTGAVALVGEDGEPGEALPDGEYELEGGGKLVVKEGKRENGEAPAPVEGAADEKPGDNPGSPAAPEAGTTEGRLNKVEQQVSEILDIVKKLAPDPASEPAAPKLAAQLNGVALADLGPKLAELKLDAIELEGGDQLVYNPVSRQLRNQEGALVESGYFAGADGSYFCVSTDQYIWSIDKQTYDAVYGAKLAEAELKVKLAAAQAQLATQPAAQRISLGSDASASQPAAPTGTAKQKAGLHATAHLRSLQEAGTN